MHRDGETGCSTSPIIRLNQVTGVMFSPRAVSPKPCILQGDNCLIKSRREESARKRKWGREGKLR